MSATPPLLIINNLARLVPSGPPLSLSLPSGGSFRQDALLVTRLKMSFEVLSIAKKRVR